MKRRNFIQTISLAAISPVILSLSKISNKHMVKKMSFSTEHLEAYLISDGRHLIKEKSIVYNLSNHPLMIDNDSDITILPWQSAILNDIEIIPEKALVIRVLNSQNLAAECLSKWTNYNELNADFPKGNMLFISPQEEVAESSFNPKHFRGDNFNDGVTRNFKVKVNLWYTPSNNNCGIHTGHQFLEVHTQIYGTGHMQAFKSNDEQTLYRDLPLLPGNTHEPWFAIHYDGSWSYPWHRYLSETDCIWMAIEFHPA